MLSVKNWRIGRGDIPGSWDCTLLVEFAACSSIPLSPLQGVEAGDAMPSRLYDVVGRTRRVLEVVVKGGISTHTGQLKQSNRQLTRSLSLLELLLVGTLESVQSNYAKEAIPS